MNIEHVLEFVVVYVLTLDDTYGIVSMTYNMNVRSNDNMITNSQGHMT